MLSIGRQNCRISSYGCRLKWTPYETIRKQKQKIRMANEIAKVFSSEKFGNVRVVVLSDGPWFVGKDVADILGYQNGS